MPLNTLDATTKIGTTYTIRRSTQVASQKGKYFRSPVGPLS